MGNEISTVSPTPSTTLKNETSDKKKKKKLKKKRTEKNYKNKNLLSNPSNFIDNICINSVSLFPVSDSRSITSTYSEEELDGSEEDLSLAEDYSTDDVSRLKTDVDSYKSYDTAEDEVVPANKTPLASSFAKRCYFTKAGIGKMTQHYEGLTLTGNTVLMLASAMKLKGCPTICDEDLRRVEQTYPNQFSRLPDELLLSSGWRRISKYCHFSFKPIPDGVPFFHSKFRCHPKGGFYFLIASAIGMIRPADVEPMTRDTLVVLETDFPASCDAAPRELISDPNQWVLVSRFCFFSGGPINTEEDVYYEANWDGTYIYMLAFLSPSLTPKELYRLDDPEENWLKSCRSVQEVETVYDLTERDFDDLKLYHLGPCRALPQYILQPGAWRKVLPNGFVRARAIAMERAKRAEYTQPISVPTPQSMHMMPHMASPLMPQSPMPTPSPHNLVEAWQYYYEPPPPPPPEGFYDPEAPPLEQIENIDTIPTSHLDLNYEQEQPLVKEIDDTPTEDPKPMEEFAREVLEEGAFSSALNLEEQPVDEAIGSLFEQHKEDPTPEKVKSPPTSPPPVLSSESSLPPVSISDTSNVIFCSNTNFMGNNNIITTTTQEEDEPGHIAPNLDECPLDEIPNDEPPSIINEETNPSPTAITEEPTISYVTSATFTETAGENISQFTSFDYSTEEKQSLNQPMFFKFPDEKEAKPIEPVLSNSEEVQISSSHSLDLSPDYVQDVENTYSTQDDIYNTDVDNETYTGGNTEQVDALENEDQQYQENHEQYQENHEQYQENHEQYQEQYQNKLQQNPIVYSNHQQYYQYTQTTQMPIQEYNYKEQPISPTPSSPPAISPTSMPSQEDIIISPSDLEYTVDDDPPTTPDNRTPPQEQPIKYSSALRGAHELLKQSRSRRNHRRPPPIEIKKSSSSSSEEVETPSTTKSRRALILQMAKARIQKEKEKKEVEEDVEVKHDVHLDDLELD